MIKSLLAVAAALVGFAGTAHAATKPSFRVESASVSETALLVPIRIDKSAAASSYSKVSVRTVDGTAKAGVDYMPISTTITFSNSAVWWSVPVAVIARPGYQGNRSFTVHIAAVRNATITQADALVTILESEQPPAPTPTPVTWVPAPLTNGGYARITRNEVAIGNGMPGAAVGSVWYVVPNAWGFSAEGGGALPGRYIHALEPIDQIGVPFTGFYVYRDDIEGVAPSRPLAMKSGKLGLVAYHTDDSRSAVAVKRCMTKFGPQSEARSGVVPGHSYRISRRWAGPYKGMVGALSGSSADGMAVVPESCFAPAP